MRSSAPAGSVFITAGRDILLGVGGADHDNDVGANGAIGLSAGRDIWIDGFSDVTSDSFFNNTGGDVTATAGRIIRIDSLFGTDASLGAAGNAGGNVTLTPGAGNPLVLIAPALGGAVFSTSGDVTINADRMVIDSASGIIALGTGARRHDPAGKLRLGDRPRVDHRRRREHPRARGRGARSHLHADAANRQHIEHRRHHRQRPDHGNTSTGLLSLRTGGAIADGTAGEQTGHQRTQSRPARRDRHRHGGGDG